MTNRDQLSTHLKSLESTIHYMNKKAQLSTSEKRSLKVLMKSRVKVDKKIKELNALINQNTINSNRLNPSNVKNFTEEVINITLERFGHELNPLEINIEESFRQGLERLHSHPPAPRIDPWYSSFEQYTNAYSWSEWWDKVTTWPTQLWPELSTLFNLVVSSDLRNFVFHTMKDRMPFKAGTSKSFFSVNRKAGIVTIPFPTRYKINKTYPRLAGYSEEMYQEDLKLQQDKSPKGNVKLRPCSTLVSTDKNYKKVILGYLKHGLNKKDILCMNGTWQLVTPRFLSVFSQIRHLLLEESLRMMKVYGMNSLVHFPKK